MKANRWAKTIALLVLLVLALFGRKVLNFWSEWLWFGSLGYQSVYATQLATKVSVGLLAGLLFLGIVYGNLVLARRFAPGALRPLGTNVIYLRAHPYLERYLYAVLGAACLAAAFVVGRTAAGQWASILRFFHSQPFGLKDPVFGKDVSFFIFKWPFLQWTYQQVLLALVMAFMGCLGLYLASSAISVINKRLYVAPVVRTHGAVLLALLFFAKAWGYVLQAYGVLFSLRSVAYGAGYADLHATVPALRLLAVLAAIGGVLLLISVRLSAAKLLAYTVGAMVVVSLLAGSAFPTFVQKYLVEPNELDRERPYLERTIQFTRFAYGLTHADARPHEAGEALTPEALADNEVTLHSIRLWDHRPLLSTYRQVQEIRSYYEFLDVDYDRYYVDGEYRQVTLSAREFSRQKLNPTARTWVNEHLKFTHGYGVCMSPVNEVTSEGLPRLWVKNIPPASQVGASLALERPELYYGESDAGYCLVKTKEPEFDYPRGDDNVTCKYQGTGGVNLGSFARRLAFASRFSDLKLIVTRQLTRESRILLRRNIVECVNALAPFLRYDQDPYIVAAEGRLWWIIDAYTTAARFPYSEPFDAGGMNYLRNSVKVVIDPYNGTTTFYVVDPEDRVLRTYRKIFPQLFTDFDKMPVSLRPHLRYPLDLFAVQADKYATYHMTNPETFYNKEDLWHLPSEIYQGEDRRRQAPQEMKPYYVVMKLPGESREEFVLMVPLCPANKDNMIAWMCARCDPKGYGDLIVFKFPKDKLIYGPMQIEARVDQNTRISEQLTLWSQKGSDVLRGNLLVIPIAKSLLYVEPLYLQAEVGKMPELKQVIAAYEEQVVMAPSLDGALKQLFGLKTPGDTQAGAGEMGAAMTPEVSQLIQQAGDLFKSAQANATRDWAAYAKEMGQLEKVLAKLGDLNSGEAVDEAPADTTD
jgi:uncharacterized membrane protein (UPF0182 family)